MMSHCDPDVSSTDVQQATWEGEDEFGVFTSAPDLLLQAPPDSRETRSGFQPDWSLFQSGGEIRAASDQHAVEDRTDSPAILEASVDKSHDVTKTHAIFEASGDKSHDVTKTHAKFEASVNKSHGGTNSPAILEASLDKSDAGTKTHAIFDTSVNQSDCRTKTSAMLEASVKHWQSHDGIHTDGTLEADVSPWQSHDGIKTKAVLGSSTNVQQLDEDSMTTVMLKESVIQSHCGMNTSAISDADINQLGIKTTAEFKSHIESMTSAVSEKSVTQSHSGNQSAAVLATNVNRWQSDCGITTNAILEDDINQMNCVSELEMETSSPQETDDSDDDFADFQGFDDTPHRQDRPQIVNLPLHTITLPGLDPGTGWCADMASKRILGSVVIDSGVFSADLSPVPVSDTLSNSDGERVGLSDDEGVSDLPQDNPASTQTVAEPALADHKSTETPTAPLASNKASAKNCEIRNREENGSRACISHNHIRQSQEHVHHSNTFQDENKSIQSGNQASHQPDTVRTDEPIDEEFHHGDEWTAFKTSHSLPHATCIDMPSSSASELPEDDHVSNLDTKHNSFKSFTESMVNNSVPCPSAQLVSSHCHTRNKIGAFLDTDSSDKDANIPNRSTHCSKDDMAGSFKDITLNQHSESTVTADCKEREKEFSACHFSLSAYDDNDDDFGDFTSQPVITQTASHVRPLTTHSSSAFPTQTHSTDHSLGDSAGALSPDSGGTGGEGSQERAWDQTAVSTDHSWAKFGEFSDVKMPPGHEVSTHVSANDSYKSKCTDFEGALLTCFPGSMTQHSRSDRGHRDSDLEGTGQDTSSCTSSPPLRSILHTQLKNDVGSRLWSRVHDVDRSPAVTYQWSQSHTHSRLFHTLQLDAHSMLPGNRKPTVPVFAADLSVLKPVRRKDGEKAGREKPVFMSTTQSSQLLSQLVTKNVPRGNQTRTSGGVAYPLPSKMHR